VTELRKRSLLSGVVIDPSTDELPAPTKNASIGWCQHVDRVEEEPVIGLVWKIRIVILTS
jgi:hypothetical protein